MAIELWSMILETYFYLFSNLIQYTWILSTVPVSPQYDQNSERLVLNIRPVKIDL